MKATPTDKPRKERPNHADRRKERPPTERRTGEGSASALANLKTIELDRQKVRTPSDDGERGD